VEKRTNDYGIAEFDLTPEKAPMTIPASAEDDQG
jgi:hypothetical protein